MPHLLKVALLTVVAFLGGAMVFAGMRFWFATHRTVLTTFEIPASCDPDAVRIDNNDPWLDRDFILHRIAAAVILLLGVSMLCWAVALMRKKRGHVSAT